MVPTAHRLASRYPGVARKTSPGAISITRPVGDSTVIGDASRGNSKAQTSPSPPHSDRNRITSNGGTRRNAEVRLILAGRFPPSICHNYLHRVDAQPCDRHRWISPPKLGYLLFHIRWNIQNISNFENRA